MEHVDEKVEQRSGKRLRQHVLVAPALLEIRQLQIIAGEPDLAVGRELGKAVAHPVPDITHAEMAEDTSQHSRMMTRPTPVATNGTGDAAA